MLKYFETKKAFRYYIKQIDSMLPCVWFSNRSQKTSKCGKNISDTLGYASCATFLFLPQFDVICDLLLNRHTATWNLFVKWNLYFLGILHTLNTRVYTEKIQTTICGIFHSIPLESLYITRIYYIHLSGSGPECFRFRALPSPVESPLSCVLAVAPETSPATLPAGTVPEGCWMSLGSIKIGKYNLMNHQRDLMVQLDSSGNG